MPWRFEKTFNIRHVMVLVGGLTTGLGMYYNVQARIDAVAAETRLEDAQTNAELKRVSERQMTLLEELKQLRLEGNALTLDYREHKARTEK